MKEVKSIGEWGDERLLPATTFKICQISADVKRNPEGEVFTF